MQEIWKSIDGFDGYYEVSNMGKIKTCKHSFIRKDGKPFSVSEKIIKGNKDTKGYLQVELKKDGVRTIKFIHRLVAEAFIENEQNKEQVNHKDGNKLNNCVSNLEWVTCRENIHHAWKNKLNRPIAGEKHGNHKLTEQAVKYIRDNYKPRSKEFGARALARKFNVSPYPIMNIINGKGWKHVK